VTRVFVDTGIFVAAHDRGDPERQARAIHVLEALHERHEVVVSSQVLAEVFAAVTSGVGAPLPASAAADLVADVSEAATVVSVTQAVVTFAIEVMARHGLDLWQAQALATAHLEGARVLLTDGPRGGAELDGVRVVNPLTADFDAKLLE